MCLLVKKITKKGTYKETTWNGKKGDTYSINAWQKCGSCIECMNEKANAWLIRNKYENESHKDKCFITLTYKINPQILIRKHIQDFFKRLRKHLEKEKIKIRYFGCGEYGTLYGRPHYHAIIYGWKPNDSKFWKTSKKGCLIHKSETLTKIWGHGITTVQRAEDKTIPYMALYNSPNIEDRKIKLIKKEKLIEMNKQLYKNYKDKTKSMIKELKKQNKWIEVKEFNFYSQGLGFDNYIKKHFKNQDTEIWKEYVGEMTIPTQSSWIKRLANQGVKEAIEEMIRRKEIEIIREETVQERRNKKLSEVQNNRIKEIVQKIEKPLQNEEF